MLHDYEFGSVQFDAVANAASALYSPVSNDLTGAAGQAHFGLIRPSSAESLLWRSKSPQLILQIWYSLLTRPAVRSEWQRTRRLSVYTYHHWRPDWGRVNVKDTGRDFVSTTVGICRT